MNKNEFWDRAAAVNAGMLDAQGGARLVPMSHHADRDNNTLWFITANGTDAVDAVTTGPVPCAYVLAENSKGLYAHLRGTLSLSDDTAKLDELWSPIAAAWFDGGRDDPDIRLLSFKITTGEVWATSTSGIAFMFNIARATLTGVQPDMGEHFTL
jgi:general stress protein 26